MTTADEGITTGRTNPKTSGDTSGSTSSGQAPKQVVAERFAETDLATDRFINVNNGEKGTHDHDCRHTTPPAGNYGIYATANDPVVLLDVDDYEDHHTVGVAALGALPSTLKQATAHNGTHQIFAVESDDDQQIADILRDEFGKANPNPSWGEVRVANQYVVGAGSQLDGCDKEGCDECAAADGGRYTVATDAPIATITAEELVDALAADPGLSREKGTKTVTAPDPKPEEYDTDERLSHALDRDDKLRRLWEGRFQSAGYDDRSSAECALAFKLAFWFGKDKSTVRRLLNRANPPKWSERDDDSYRESVLEAVDAQDETYSPSGGRETAPAPDSGTTTVDNGGGPTPDEAAALSPVGVMQQAFADPYGRLERDPEGANPTIHDLRNAEAATYLWDVLEDRGKVDVMAVSDGSFRAFERGVWKHEDGAGEQRLRELGSKALRSFYSSNVLEQLKEETRTRNQYLVEELGIDNPWIVVGDEALNLRTRETRPVNRDDLALRRIEAEYDPDAEPDLWLDFLSRVAATPETIQKLQEYFGYTLWFHGQPFGKGLFLVGDTDSGKGTALKTLSSILGPEENVANETLKNLIGTRWGKAQLYGRIVNIRNEVTPDGLKNVEKFKELLGGGDRVTAERKGEQKFRFTVTQKFVFATNQFPDVENADNAFWNRCLFARFPETIPDDEQRPKFHDDLLAERSGILNWMLDGLDRLFEQGGFTDERSIDEKRNIAEEVGSPLERLKQDALKITREATDKVHARDLYDLATAYAEDVGMDEGVPPWQGGAFTSELRAWPGVDSGRTRQFDGSGDDRVFQGIRVDGDIAHRLNVDVRTLDETPSGQTGLDV